MQGWVLLTRARNVFVKSVKPTEISDFIDLKCLVAKLKLLIHLGPHLINLLGANTTNIDKGDDNNTQFHVIQNNMIL